MTSNNFIINRINIIGDKITSLKDGNIAIFNENQVTIIDLDNINPDITIELTINIKDYNSNIIQLSNKKFAIYKQNKIKIFNIPYNNQNNNEINISINTNTNTRSLKKVKNNYKIIELNDKSIAIHDILNKSIKIYSINGEFINDIVYKGFMSSLRHAGNNSITLIKDMIELSDKSFAIIDSKYIKILDKNGTFIDILGKHEYQQKFNSPTELIQLNDMNIATIDNNKIFIIDIFGKFIKSFEHNCSLKNIILLKNGNISVQENKVNGEILIIEYINNFLEDILFELKDPISNQLLKNPLIASDGYTYSEISLNRIFNRGGISPITNKKLIMLEIQDSNGIYQKHIGIENILIKQLVDKYIEKKIIYINNNKLNVDNYHINNNNNNNNINYDCFSCTLFNFISSYLYRDTNIPFEFQNNVSLELFKNPMVASDGMTYSSKTIKNFLKTNYRAIRGNLLFKIKINKGLTIKYINGIRNKNIENLIKKIKNKKITLIE